MTVAEMKHRQWTRTGSGFDGIERRVKGFKARRRGRTIIGTGRERQETSTDKNRCRKANDMKAGRVS